jgi:hypothetical protein
MDEQLVESDDRGLIIATLAGEIQHLCPHARRLMVLATHPELSPAAMPRAGPGPLLPPEVARLCQNLVQIFEDKPPSAAPIRQISNSWAPSPSAPIGSNAVRGQARRR